MLPQLPSPGQMSLQAATLSGNGGGATLASASLMHQGGGLTHQGSFSSQQQMMAQAQVGPESASDLSSLHPDHTQCMNSTINHTYNHDVLTSVVLRLHSCLRAQNYTTWSMQTRVLFEPDCLLPVLKTSSMTTVEVLLLDLQMQQPSTAVSHQETHVYTQSSETLKAHANVLKVGLLCGRACSIVLR